MRELENDRYQFTRQFAQGMIDHPLSLHELDWIVSQSLRTPTFVALLLLFDVVNDNYQPEAFLLSSTKVPTLNVVAKPMGKMQLLGLKSMHHTLR